MSERLHTFGWNDFFARHFAPHAGEGFDAGRVAVQHKGHYDLYTALGELRGEMTGKLQYLARGPQDLPAVGDWVVIQARPAEGTAVIHDILPRKSQFVRRAAGLKDEEQIVAANIDVVFLVMGLDGNFNLPRIERYLVLAWESGANPVIVLNKADLCPAIAEKQEEIAGVALGVPTLVMSATHQHGVAAIHDFLPPGTTGALLGSSGVGKSTIINQLLGREQQRVTSVRESDARGRHTTARRELLLLPTGALLMDTPGMRELQLWGGEEGLQDTFEDIAALAENCRFRNCRHLAEPDCAVRQAVEQGELEERRYQNYLKLQRELAHEARKSDVRAQIAEKNRIKKLMSAHKHSYKKK